MNAQELMKRAKEKVHKKQIEEMQGELERLIEKEAKAQLILDNIKREKEDKIACIDDKLHSLMSCTIPGFSGSSDGSPE